MASDVDTYAWIMDFLADRGVGENAFSLRALPPNRREKMGDSEHIVGMDPHAAFLPSSSFRKMRKPQRYEPAIELTQYFWRNGHLFIFTRRRERRRMVDGNMDMATSLIEARLRCLSRTTAPIKALIEEASLSYHKKSYAKTAIRRPAPRQQRNEGGNPWKTVARRPSRPLNTVVIEKDKKAQIILDIQEYMQPSSRKYYAERGIPYRRGYVGTPVPLLFARS